MFFKFLFTSGQCFLRPHVFSRVTFLEVWSLYSTEEVIFDPQRYFCLVFFLLFVVLSVVPCWNNTLFLWCKFMVSVGWIEFKNQRQKYFFFRHHPSLEISKTFKTQKKLKIEEIAIRGDTLVAIPLIFPLVLDIVSQFFYLSMVVFVPFGP